jgi:universal stress protein A
MFAPRRILVPTDFSDYSDEALKQALELARQFHAKVYLMHVTEPVRQCGGDYCLDTSTFMQAESAENIRVEEMMEKELNKFSEYRDVEIISDIREGETVEEILHEQEERGVDLIVMPSHAKKGFLDRVMKHVSGKVMEEAKTPVLFVRH